ncbi:unnamed protein product [[Candida] boidinii]|nr:unnamed protein product [[Candida] boidinii]
MSNHILKNLPSVDSNIVNMKKTTWKKSSKYLKAMEKSGLLTVKGKGDNLTITTLANSDHERVKKFEPYPIKKQPASQQPTTSKPKSSLPGAGQLEVVQLYRPSSLHVGVMEALSLSYGYYTAAEIKQMLVRYIKEKNLAKKGDPKMITLDETLRKITNQRQSISVTLDRVKLAESFLKSFPVFHKISDPSQPSQTKSAPVRGPVPTVYIIEELKIGRKTVTRVFGFEDFLIKPKEFSAELRVKCSGSTTVGPNVQQPKFTEVVVQGSHHKIVTEILVARGLKTSWISFENKVKSKKRK